MPATLHLAEALHCPPSERIPWIPSGGIDVGDPWHKYPSPNSKCCAVTDPGTAFNAQGKHTCAHIRMHVFARCNGKHIRGVVNGTRCRQCVQNV